MKTKILLSFFLFIPAGFSETVPSALEEEFRLFEAEDITVTASKKEQKAKEAPATVAVLTKEEIRRLPGITIPDILRYVSGTEVYWAYESFPVVGVRGFTDESNNQILLLVDGREINSEALGAPLWFMLPVSLEEIERIEIVKGPGSTLYGPNAFSGIVNIITKRAGEEKKKIFWFRTSEGAEPFQSRNELGYAGFTKKGLSYRVSGNFDLSTFSLEPSQTDLATGGGRILIEGSPSEKINLSFTGGGGGGKGIYLYPFSPAFANGKNAFGLLKGEFYSFFLQFNWNFNSVEFKPFHPSLIQNLDGKSFTLGVHTLSLEGRYSRSFGEIFEIKGGVELRSNLYRNSGLSLGYNSLNETRYGIYAEGEVKPLRFLKISAGLRFDDSLYLEEKKEDTISPRIAFIATFGDHTLRLSASRAFRRPSFLEYGGEISGWTHDSINSVAGGEEIHQFNEVINALEFSYLTKLFERIKGEVSFFGEYFQNTISFDFNDFRYANLEGNFVSYGGEISLDFLLLKNLSLNLNYAFQLIEARTDIKYGQKEAIVKKGDRILWTPQHKLNAGVRWTPAEILTCDLFFTLYSERRYPQGTVLNPTTLAGPSGGQVYNLTDEIVGPNYLLNFQSILKITKNISIGFLGRNLLYYFFAGEAKEKKFYPGQVYQTSKGFFLYYGGDYLPAGFYGFLRVEI